MYIEWVVMGVLIVVSSLVIILVVLVSSLLFKMFIDSRVMVYLFGWSYWDSKIVEEMKKEGVVESVEFGSDGVRVSVVDSDRSLGDYTFGFDERFVNYNTEIVNQ